MSIDFGPQNSSELRERFQKLQDKLARLEKIIDQQISSQQDMMSKEYQDMKESRIKEFSAAQLAFEEISERYQQVKREYDKAEARLREAARLVREVDREGSRDSAKTRKEIRALLFQEIKDIRAELRNITQIFEKGCEEKGSKEIL